MIAVDPHYRILFVKLTFVKTLPVLDVADRSLLYWNTLTWDATKDANCTGVD